MKLAVFPESLLRCMSPEDRKAIGQMTASEAQERYTRGRERELKALVVNWLNLTRMLDFRTGDAPQDGRPVWNARHSRVRAA